MAIFDILSEKDKVNISEYIYFYGAREGHKQHNAPLEDILSFWDESKSKYLYKMLGDNFIVSKNFSFEKSENELADEMGKLTNYYCYDTPAGEFIQNWKELATKLFINSKSLYWSFMDLINNYTLASNRYAGSSFEIPLPGDKIYRVSNGAKVSKAIGKIATAYNLPYYEEFRISHSQVLNQKKVEGEICLSIHPLDYMTMSDNDCGWSSCMSWADYGDFRQGTVEMMNSPMVVVAYLKSNTDFCINSESYWNSKRWRELFIVTPEIIMGIKGYPYWNRELEKGVIQWIRELAIENLGFDFENEVRDYDSRDRAVTGTDIDDLSFRTNLMYNDVYDMHSIVVTPRWGDITGETINYSGVSECLCCGQKLYDYDSEQDLFCLQCDDVIRCAECGEYIRSDEAYEVDGSYYCSYCYEALFHSCDACGYITYVDDLCRVYFGQDKKHVYLDNYIEICGDCYASGKYFDSNDVKNVYERLSVYPFITPEDLTEKGLELFGFTSYDEALQYNTRNRVIVDEHIDF